MMFFTDYEHDDDPEVEELRAQSRFERRYQADLARHPDCRDPDHPGCPQCEDEDDIDDPTWED